MAGIESLREWDPAASLLQAGKFPSVFVVGPRGSGKTTMVAKWVSIVLAADKSSGYDLIFVYSNAAATLESYKQFVPHVRYPDCDKPLNFIEWSANGPDHLKKLLEHQGAVVAKKKKPMRLLVILDDVISERIKYSDEATAVNNLFIYGRHHHIGVWLLSQTFNNVPTSIHKNADLTALFSVRSGTERDHIISETVRGAIRHEDLDTVGSRTGRTEKTTGGLAQLLYDEATQDQGVLMVDFRSTAKTTLERLGWWRASAADIARTLPPKPKPEGEKEELPAAGVEEAPPELELECPETLSSSSDEAAAPEAPRPRGLLYRLG